MAMPAHEVASWIKTLKKDDMIGIDEGGLVLCVAGSVAYLEIGGMPREDDDGDDKE